MNVNIGCGMTPTPGWNNYDNSWSVRLANWLVIVSMLERFRLLTPSQITYINFAKQNNISWADATKSIPLENNSVGILYSSHMLEHLDSKRRGSFLGEARRVLKEGGVIRLVVPDLRIFVDRYNENGDADEFVHKLHMNRDMPSTLGEKLRYFLIGDRHHQWNYDGNSLCKLMSESGFINPVVLSAGNTTLKNSGPLDLSERAEESLYVEARKPQFRPIDQ